ncbi:MAG: histidine phosphatase family protein [Paraglaciecola sp.]|uniref:histidine phosphatase family protein n=1 Tax=Paraglaciecola sp. TaxID=1920173 RepID=UPI0032979183
MPASSTKIRSNLIYLYLCRHGQSQYNARGLLQGQVDNPLTALGEEQAISLALRAKYWNIKQVVSSPLKRAKQTAQLCATALHLPVDLKKGLEERHFGDWQGQALSKLSHYQDFILRCYTDTDLTPSKGAETTANVRDRMFNQLDTIANQAQGNVLLISHGDAINCLLSVWKQPIKIANCQEIRLIKKAGGFVLDTQ